MGKKKFQNKNNKNNQGISSAQNNISSIDGSASLSNGVSNDLSSSDYISKKRKKNK